MLKKEARKARQSSGCREAPRCSPLRSATDQWLNRTKAEQDQFLITINATAFVSPQKSRNETKLPSLHRVIPRKWLFTAVRWERWPTCSRRRSNFFQYWNIDPTSAAILGYIEEIFFAPATINIWAGFPSLSSVDAPPREKKNVMKIAAPLKNLTLMSEDAGRQDAGSCDYKSRRKRTRVARSWD